MLGTCQVTLRNFVFSNAARHRLIGETGLAFDQFLLKQIDRSIIKIKSKEFVIQNTIEKYWF